MFRIATNYLRMAANFVLGLILVRLLVQMDEGIYAVVVLLGTSIGISGMMKEIVRAAMIAEVGLAYHQHAGRDFGKVYSTAFGISVVAAGVAVGILAIFYFALDYLSVPNELRAAAAYYLLWRALHTFVSISLAPTTNLLIITKRMGLANVWLTLERLAEVACAFWVLQMATESTPSEMLEAFAFYGTIAMLAVDILWVGSVVISDRRFLPSITGFDSDSFEKIIGTVGWNGFVVAAMNLYGPFITVVVNIVFGVAATIIFGLAIQLVNYIRIAVMGMVFGLDAVFTSKTNHKVTTQREMVSRLTYLQSLMVLGACTFCAINIETILRLWVGQNLSDPAVQIPQAAMLFNILMIGVAARSVTEGWMKYLSGIGEVRAYGPTLLKGALFNPPLLFVLVYLLPAEFGILGPAIAFSVLLFIVHLYFLPQILKRFLEVSFGVTMMPILKPVLFSILAGVISILCGYITGIEGISALLVSATIFAMILGPLFIREFLKLPRYE